MEEEESDNSSIDSDSSSTNARSPPLDFCIKQVMSHKRTEYHEKRQKAFKNARRVAESLLQYTYSIHPLYQKYIRVQKSGKIEILNFRAIDSDVFLCVVPLKRPIRPYSFTFHHKRPQEFPPHRMYLSLNESIPRGEMIALKQEWGHCVDKRGIVRPDLVLRWFNKGLKNTCDIFQHAEVFKNLDPRRKREEDFFEMFLEKSRDGTMWTYIRMGENSKSAKLFKINFVPSIPLQEIPKQLRMPVPIPNRRPYVMSRSEFTRNVTKDIDNGTELFYLEARLFHWTLASGYQQSVSVSWGVGSTNLEDRAYKEITMVTNKVFLDNIILLMGQIKAKHKVGLYPISNRVILNAIFHAHRKHLGTFTKGEEWFMGVLDILLSQLKANCAPAFFLNKLNLLEHWNMKSMKDATRELKRIIRGLKRDPETLYEITGYREKVQCVDCEVQTSDLEEFTIEQEYTDSEKELEDEQRDFNEEAQFDSDNYIADKDSLNRSPSDTDSEDDRERSHDTLSIDNHNLQSIITESWNDEDDDFDDVSRGRS